MTHGGARKGAGRKPVGITKKISLTLPESDWEYIQHLLTQNKDLTLAGYVRGAVDRTLTDDLQSLNSGNYTDEEGF